MPGDLGLELAGSTNSNNAPMPPHRASLAAILCMASPFDDPELGAFLIQIRATEDIGIAPSASKEDGLKLSRRNRTLADGKTDITNTIGTIQDFDARAFTYHSQIFFAVLSDGFYKGSAIPS